MDATICMLFLWRSLFVGFGHFTIRWLPRVIFGVEYKLPCGWDGPCVCVGVTPCAFSYISRPFLATVAISFLFCSRPTRHSLQYLFSYIYLLISLFISFLLPFPFQRFLFLSVSIRHHTTVRMKSNHFVSYIILHLLGRPSTSPRFAHHLVPFISIFTMSSAASRPGLLRFITTRGTCVFHRQTDRHDDFHHNLTLTNE